ncbi:L-lactate permease [Rappaport israeli]|uniref:L-lactate permease n=1 Tax=Rappaport israeli TaxID=1839807 RepID=UPI000A7F850B|nr:L-lactate permease [Rappaport israeli]
MLVFQLLFFLIGLTLLKLKGYNAAGLIAIVSLVIAVFTFKLPVEAVLPSIVQGFAQATNLTLPFIYFSVPFLLVFLLDGIRGIKETLPAILVTSIVFTTLQVSIMQFLGSKLAALCASLSTLAALAFLAHNWQPACIFRINANSEQTQSQPEVDTEENLPSYGTIFKAWAPFSVLSAFMILWGMPFFKALFKTDAPFAFTNLSFQLLETTPSGAPITLNISLVSVVGTAIFITIILTIIGTGIRPKEALKELKTTIKSFWLSVLTVCLVLVVAKLMTYSRSDTRIRHCLNHSSRIQSDLKKIK